MLVELKEGVADLMFSEICQSDINEKMEGDEDAWLRDTFKCSYGNESNGSVDDLRSRIVDLLK